MAIRKTTAPARDDGSTFEMPAWHYYFVPNNQLPNSSLDAPPPSSTSHWSYEKFSDPNSDLHWMPLALELLAQGP